MRLTMIPVVAALLAGCATAATPDTRTDYVAREEARLAKALAGRVAGAPVDCLQLRDIRSSRIYDGIAIVYEGSNGTLYVNRPTSGASALRSDPVLVTDTHSSQLCSIDVVKLVDRGSHMYAGSVFLDKFVPYRRAN